MKKKQQMLSCPKKKEQVGLQLRQKVKITKLPPEPM